jgi:hypothetical protein
MTPRAVTMTRAATACAPTSNASAPNGRQPSQATTGHSGGSAAGGQRRTPAPTGCRHPTRCTRPPGAAVTTLRPRRRVNHLSANRGDRTN